ncbi:Crp/Fnr family transcriptional regulator [Chitinophaga sp. 22536]|uniref:Crp/Fnr family transcriptional regulator n=1 Tax=unclassified Chitinophaga TaxID=2619133 RepID=UPI003F8522A1
MHPLLLHNFSRHIVLSDEETASLPAYFRHRKLRRKELLLEEGEVCRSENFVIKGALRQYETDEEGREHVIQFAFEDWWISDPYSMHTGTPSIYHIDALEDSEVLQLDLDSQERLFADLPQMNIYWRLIMQQAFIALQRRVLFLQKPLEERYQEFLRTYAWFEQRIPQHQVAAYLGTSRESLSRVRNTVLKK